MFKNVYQSGLISIFYSCGARPLELWDVEVKNGHIKRITDCHVRSIVLEILGSNVSTTFITCPKGGKSLGINLPFMILIVKNLKKHFTFEVTVLDDGSTRRRFRISNFQSTTQIQPLCTSMPITLNNGWNQIQFDLATFTQRSYKTQFVEVVKLKINANIRLRRVYFTETLLPEDQLPPEYKLYVPLSSTKKLIEKKSPSKENVNPSSSKASDKKDSKVDVSKINSKPSINIEKKPSRNEIKLESEQILEVVNETKETENLVTMNAPKDDSAIKENENTLEIASRPEPIPVSVDTTATEPTHAVSDNKEASPENGKPLEPAEAIDPLQDDVTAVTIEAEITDETVKNTEATDGPEATD